MSTRRDPDASSSPLREGTSASPLGAAKTPLRDPGSRSAGEERPPVGAERMMSMAVGQA